MTDAGKKHFVLVAGEASGDLLGADLIRALRERFPTRHLPASAVRR
jgi:lipid A disaccharide synthetase